MSSGRSRQAELALKKLRSDSVNKVNKIDHLLLIKEQMGARSDDFDE